MSEIINDLVRKLKRAERAAVKAQRAYDQAQGEARALLKELEASRGRVQELESAISILRNNLRPGTPPAGEKVVQLKK